MRKVLYIILFLNFFYSWTKAQNPYEPYIAQYMTEGLAINPAFAGNREVLSLSAIYRNSLANMPKSVTYQTLNVHTPLVNTKIGIGASLLHVSPGPISEYWEFYLNYAYRTDFIGGKLALGIKAGAENRSIKYTEVETLIKGDQAFQEDYNNFRFNGGFGFQYYSDRFYVGGSVPKLITDTDTSGFNLLNYNYFLNGGFYFGNIRNAKLGPTLLLNLNPNSSLNYIVGLHGNIWKLYGTLGYVGYNASLVNVQFKLNEQIHMGVAWEFGLDDISSYVSNSFEILLRYEFRYVVRSENPLDF